MCYVLVIVDKLVQWIKQEMGWLVCVEGLFNVDWVLIDVGDVIVYLFCLEVCSFYNFECMWLFGDVLLVVVVN